MKKISTLLAAVAISAAANAVSAETWCMPGTYQGWSLEKNLFEAVGDGTYTQTIPDLYGDFKIVMYEGGANWNNAWGTNGNTAENGVAYEAVKSANNIVLAGNNLHYINAKVTITPGEGDALTVLVQAEQVVDGEETWKLAGAAPLTWTLPDADKFERGENGVWTLTYNGTINDAFKIVHNDAWGNAYTTEGTIELGKEYVIAAPKDPADNMSPADGPWENPTFTIVDNGDAGIVLTVTAGNSGVEAIEADAAKGEAVYFNLQGQRVANPENGLYIRLQDGKATKVAL